jgi:hypothetical protein
MRLQEANKQTEKIICTLPAPSLPFARSIDSSLIPMLLRIYEKKNSGKIPIRIPGIICIGRSKTEDHTRNSGEHIVRTHRDPEK